MSTRTFHRGDPEPANVTEVFDRDGDRWTRAEGLYRNWVCDGYGGKVTSSWTALADEYDGELTAEIPDQSSLIKLPPLPQGRVRAVGSNLTFTYDDEIGRFVRDSDGGSSYLWHDLLATFPDGVEPYVESEYDAAVRRLKEHLNPSLESGVDGYVGRATDIDVVIRNVVYK